MAQNLRALRSRLFPVTGALLLGLLGACGSSGEPDPTTISRPATSDPTTAPEMTGPDMTGPVTIGPGGSGSPSSGAAVDLEAHTGIARADLADRLGVDPDSLDVVTAETTTWPDSSLGCPQPDQMYTQVLTDGALIVFEAGGQRYEYHSGTSVDPFLCEQ